MTTFTVLCNMDTPNGVLWCKNGNTIYTPEDMPVMIKDLIEVPKGKKDKEENRVVFINKLRYYGLDIIQVLHVLGYTESETDDKKKMPSGSYTYLIGDNLCFYKIHIKYSKRYQVTILDSDNVLSISDSHDIIDTWGNGDKTVIELSKAYKKAFSELFGMTGIKTKIPVTIAGIARRVYFRDTQKHYDCKDCTKFFDNAESFFRGSYHGGLNIMKNEGIVNNRGFGIVLDVNSLYPYVMREKIYPVGKPWHVSDEMLIDTMKKSKEGKIYYFIHIKTSFTIKDGCVPCICMSKKDPLRWCHEKQWMSTSAMVRPDGNYNKKLDIIDLYLTQTDFELFLDNYEIQTLEIIDCYAFQGKRGIFSEYVSEWYNLKKSCIGGRRRIAKILLNSLSGSMARRTDYINGIVYFDERDQAQVKYDKIKQRNPKCYVHIGSAITSYAREVMVKAIKKNYDRWIYTDTDSLHLTNINIPINIRVSNEIGDFKIEKMFTEITYYKLKEYGYKDENGYHFILAGVEKRDITEIENFVNHKNPTVDRWIAGKYAKEWKNIFSSDNILEDFYTNHFPVSFRTHAGWFNTRIIPSWNIFSNNDGKTIKGRKIKCINTTVKAERERDEKALKWYKNTHEQKVVPVEIWLKHLEENERKAAYKENQEKLKKSGDFYDVDEEIPFSN